MNPPPIEPHPQPSKGEANQALKLLIKTLCNIPEGELADVYAVANDLDPHTSDKKLLHQASAALEILSVRAHSGSESAIRAIAQIGVLAAKALDFITEKIPEDLRSKTKTIATAPASSEEKTPKWSIGPRSDPFQIRTHVLTILRAPAGTFKLPNSKVEYSKYGVSVFDLFGFFMNWDAEGPQQPWIRLLSEDPELCDVYGGLPDDDKLLIHNRTVLEGIVNNVTGVRIERHAKTAGRNLAGKVLEWPHCLFADVSDQTRSLKTQLDILNLGSSIPAYSLERKNLSLSCYDHYSNKEFTLSVVAALEIHRSKRFFLPGSEYWEFRKCRDPWLENCSKMPWHLKASYLPALTANPADLKKWQDVSLAYLEDLCQSKWDDHPWPKCVQKHTRVHSQSPTYRRMKSSVSEAIRLGLKSLAKK